MNVSSIPLISGGQPLLGHWRRMQTDRFAFIQQIAREVDRVARFSTPVGSAMLVNHPETIQEVLVEKAKVFDKSDMTRFALYPLAGEGLFTSRYDFWRGQRKLMAPLFHPSHLERYARDMVACTTRVIDEWKDDTTIELARETTRITMSVAGKTLFDADTFSDADEIGHALTFALEWTAKHAPSFFALAHIVCGRAFGQLADRLPRAEPSLRSFAGRFTGPVFLPGSEGRELREAMALLDTHVQRMIDARRKETVPREDLLSKLLRAHDEDTGERMTDKQVRDEVITLFVAGHETTATGLAWAIHCLCANPEVYAAAEREALALPADPTSADLPRLPLASRVFRESLRLYPPVYMFGRQGMTASSIDGYDTPKNVVVLVSPYALHRRPDLWPDPEKFDPDRFLPEVEAARPKLAYLPFGAGPRVCIGNHFALMEGQLVLATLLRRARFEAVGHEVPDLLATLRPKNGMKMKVRLRQNEPTRR